MGACIRTPCFTNKRREINSENIESRHTRGDECNRPKNKISHVLVIRAENNCFFTKVATREREPG